MKMFMSFMKHSYDNYFMMDKCGEYHTVTRGDCFAPSYDNRQRWYWDDEEHTIVVRLPLTEQGIKIGNAHLASLKKNERDLVAKIQCVSYGTNQCRVTCDICVRAERCTSKQRENEGLKCRRKCEGCSSYVSRITELNRPIEYDARRRYNRFEPVASDDPQTEVVKRAEIKALMDALKILTEAQQELIRYIFWNGMTEREIAPLLGVKSSKTVNYRKRVILDILESDKLLRSFFEIL